MSFFADRIEWGTSIRGAWWGNTEGQIEFQSCGLFCDGEQLYEPMKFSMEEWDKFIMAIIEFVKG